jgi:uncharacterized repeat protein (TIGR01451 family)
MSQRAPRLGRRGLVCGVVLAAVSILGVGPSAWTAQATEGPDVRLDMLSDAAGPLSPGGSVTHVISVSNVGDSDAHDVIVTDDLPTGVSLAGAPQGCVDGGDTVVCALDAMAPDAEQTIGLTIDVDATTCGDISDVASVSSSDEPATNVDDANHDSVTETVTCATPEPPDLVLDKTSDATDALPRGHGIVYTLTVANVGDATATGIHVHDDVPPGLQIMGTLPTIQGGTCSAIGTVDSDGNEIYAIDCRRSSLAAGASATVTIRMRVDTAARCGRLVNTAWVTGANEPKARRDALNRDAVSDRIVCDASIALEGGGPSAAHLGDDVTYTLRASNDGERPLADVHVRDAECDRDVRRTDDGNGDHTLSRGETWIYTCTSTVEAADGDPARTTASVTAADPDGHRVRDAVRRSVDVLHPGIAIVVTPSTVSGAPGSAITFTYALTNTGDTPLFDVRVVDDVLGAVGRIPSIRPGERRTLRIAGVLPAGTGEVRTIGTASGRDPLGATVSGRGGATVALLAASWGAPGEHGGSGFTGAGTRVPAALSVLLLVLGIGAVAIARRTRPGSTGA